MKKLPDSSAYYTKELALQEEANWLLAGHYKRSLQYLLPRLAQHEVRTIVECGCGSGLVAAGLPSGVEYVGLDTCPHFLEMANRRCETSRIKGKRFLCWDVRNFQKEGDEPADLVLALGFLKHFSLEEWDKMVKAVLALGRQACFSMQVWSSDDDDGKDYHHVFVTREHLELAVAVAGHQIMETETISKWDRGGKDAEDVMVWTKQVVPIEQIVRGNKVEELTETDVPPRQGPKYVHLAFGESKMPLCDPGDPQFLAVDKTHLVTCPDCLAMLHDREVTNRVVQEELAKDAGAPTRKFNQQLVVADLQVTDLHRYALRWNGWPGAEEPELYRDGRRVTQPWRLVMDVDKPEDEKGASR